MGGPGRAAWIVPVPGLQNPESPAPDPRVHLGVQGGRPSLRVPLHALPAGSVRSRVRFLEPAFGAPRRRRLGEWLLERSRDRSRSLCCSGRGTVSPGNP